jgi:hypothetical protein
MFWNSLLLLGMISLQDPYSLKEDGPASRASTSTPEEIKTDGSKIFSYKKPIIEKTETSGALKPEQVKKPLNKNSSRFKTCFSEKSKEKLKMEFEINKSGKVPKESIKGKDRDLDKCIAKIIQEINFPKPVGEERVKVRQTFGDPTVENDGYSGLQNHYCKRRVFNFLIYARIKIISALDENHYKASLQSVEKIICEYSNQFPIKPKEHFILKTEEMIDPKKNCAYLPLARTWQVYESNILENSISLWVWKIAPKSFLVEQLYEAPIFYKCKQ